MQRSQTRIARALVLMYGVLLSGSVILGCPSASSHKDAGTGANTLSLIAPAGHELPPQAGETAKAATETQGKVAPDPQQRAELFYSAPSGLMSGLEIELRASVEAYWRAYRVPPAGLDDLERAGLLGILPSNAVHITGLPATGPSLLDGPATLETTSTEWRLIHSAGYRKTIKLPSGHPGLHLVQDNPTLQEALAQLELPRERIGLLWAQFRWRLHAYAVHFGTLPASAHEVMRGAELPAYLGNHFGGPDAGIQIRISQDRQLLELATHHPSAGKTVVTVFDRPFIGRAGKVMKPEEVPPGTVWGPAFAISYR